MNDDFLDNADGLYFTEVEDEDGLNVELNETLKSNLAGPDLVEKVAKC